MRHWLINNQLDLVLFATGIIGLTVAVEWLWLRRQMDGRGFPRPLWALLFVVIVGGCVWSVKAGRFEQNRLQDMVAGFAPTYAAELAHHGIDKINLDTAPDDPAYLELIKLETQWLESNPGVADIYTFTHNAAGKIVLLVDSETDYDRNGKYEGDRESRTPIGEAYEESEAELTRAFAGEQVFMADPSTDRWGTWVSCFVPIRRTAGTVIGVLGVDYPAARWVESIFFYRGAILGLAGIVSMILVGFSAAITIQKAEVDKRARIELLLVNSRRELSQLTDALHARVEQRTQELDAAHRDLQTALRAKDADAVTFCKQLRDLAPAAASPATALGAAIDDREDLARLQCRQLEVVNGPASTLDMVSTAIASARARLNGVSRVDAVIATPVPETIATDGPQLARLLARACNLVGESQPSGTVHLGISAIDTGTAEAALDIVVRCDGSAPAPGQSRLFASHANGTSVNIDELGDQWKVSQSVLTQLGGRITVSQKAEHGYEVHVSVPIGAVDASRVIDPATCAARLAA